MVGTEAKATQGQPIKIARHFVYFRIRADSARLRRATSRLHVQRLEAFMCQLHRTAHCKSKHAHQCTIRRIDSTINCDEDASDIDWIERKLPLSWHDLLISRRQLALHLGPFL